MYIINEVLARYLFIYSGIGAITNNIMILFKNLLGVKMKKKLFSKALLLIIIYLMISSVSMLFAVDTVPPSFEPPGNIPVNKTPQFIVFGFDDNRYTDGMQWVLDILEGKKNPAGSGNAATFDGQPLKVSFYYTSNALDTGGAELLAQWQRATNAGHEVGNHTVTHRDNELQEPFIWYPELTGCNDALVQNLGVAKTEITGVRAPYLDFLQPPLFATLKDGVDSIIYDCSIRHDPYGDDPNNWRFYRHIWPYTLENGIHAMTAGGYSIGNLPGFWEIPCYSLPRSNKREDMMQPSNMYTGFDSTAYGTLKISATDFYNSLVWALDFRLAEGDNRAPLTIGAHSDTYSALNTGYDGVATLEERRKAVTDFIDYALTKPDVRFVTTQQLIDWMRNPVALGDVPVQTPTPTVTPTPTQTPTPVPVLENIALGKPVTVSSEFSADFKGINATDGNANSIWGAVSSANQWIFVDLGEMRDIKGINLNWFDKYFPKAYSIGVSNNGKDWNLVLNLKKGVAGPTELRGDARVRYVGVLCTQKNDIAYALTEFEILAEKPLPTAEPTITPTPTQTIGVTPTPTANGYPDWAVGADYQVNDIVFYQGKYYKCLVAHKSIADWYPGASGVYIWEETNV